MNKTLGGTFTILMKNEVNGIELGRAIDEFFQKLETEEIKISNLNHYYNNHSVKIEVDKETKKPV